MHVRFAFLCDYAQDSGNGKISALGIGIDNFFVPNLTQPISPFCLVVNLEANRSEAGQKQFEIHLMNEDGQTVIPPIKGEIVIPVPSHGIKTGAGIVAGFTNIIFPNYGSFQISFLINGQEFVNIPITVSPPPNAK